MAKTLIAQHRTAVYRNGRVVGYNVSSDYIEDRATPAAPATKPPLRTPGTTPPTPRPPTLEQLAEFYAYTRQARAARQPRYLPIPDIMAEVLKLQAKRRGEVPRGCATCARDACTCAAVPQGDTMGRILALQRQRGLR